MDLALQHTFADQLEGAYASWQPQGFPAPRLIRLNENLRVSLGLPEIDPALAAGLFSGTTLPGDARPLAQAYAGHQFGGFNPQLGDGRALLLGELVDGQGRRFDLQLKGSGPTPFSRRGDGRAAVGPVLREHLVSEAMHRLGVPTTRVLATVRTGETIRRQMPLPGACLARIAASHLRVGTLQLFAARQDLLARMVDYTLARHWPEAPFDGPPALRLLYAVAEAQAALIAQWMQIGFIHGVMNTDNMTLSGETIDYGPCAFMDTYDPATVFSSIDHAGRYAYGNQPGIGRWNLARLGEALLSLIDADQEAAVEKVYPALDHYAAAFHRHMMRGMARKLGFDAGPDQISAEDAALVSDLFDWMKAAAVDHTQTYRALAEGLRQGEAPFEGADFAAWRARWLGRLGGADLKAVAAEMDAVNPIYIPRNHLVEEALAAAEADDLGPFDALMAVLRDPYTARPELSRYAGPAPADFGPYQTFCGT